MKVRNCARCGASSSEKYFRPTSSGNPRKHCYECDLAMQKEWFTPEKAHEWYINNKKHCIVEGCNNVAVKKNRTLCVRHHDNMEQYGEYNPDIIKETAGQRLLKYSRQLDNGCWEWTGHRNPVTDYGGLSWQGQRWYAHRLAYQTWVAPIPEGLHVLHTCDTPPCINPRHLWVGTPADNMRDRDLKGRSRFGPNAPSKQRIMNAA